MKTSIFTFIAVLMATSLMAQDKFTKTMQASINELYTAQTIEALDANTNKFNRIGQAEETRWEPFYYASLGQVFRAFRIEDLLAKDAVLDQALAHLDKADDVSENNVEIILLEGFINMIKIGVDPGTRGQSLSPKIMAAFGKALKMEPNNPRANLFMAQMQIGTSQFFGTDPSEHCAMLNKAVKLFDEQEPSSPIAPMWGKDGANGYRELCGSPE